MEENNEGSNVINIRPEGAVDVSEEVEALIIPEFKTIEYQEFLKIRQFIRQRNTEGRAKNPGVKKILKVLLSDHTTVAIGVLDNDCYYGGVAYTKGEEFLLDGHTRRYFWENGKSDTTPKKVYATMWHCSSMEEMVGFYERYDNSNAQERGSDKLYGAYRFEKMTIGNTKLNGIMPFGYAAHYYNKDKFSRKKGLSIPDIGAVVSEFKEQIEILDKTVGPVSDEFPNGTLAKKSGRTRAFDFHNAIICASLISLKSWGVTTDNAIDHPLVEVLKNINNAVKNETGTTGWSGATHIVREFSGQGDTLKKNTDGAICFDYSSIENSISFVLYWLHQEMENKKLLQIGGNWKTYINRYPDRVAEILGKQIYSSSVENILK